MKLEAKRILLSRLRFIGDVILTTQTIRTFRINYPRAHLTYLVEEEANPVLEGNPYLDELIVLPHKASFREVLNLVRRIQREKYDFFIDFFSNPRSALLAGLSGARWRMGYPVKGRGVVYNLKFKTEKPLSAIESHLQAAVALGLKIDSDLRTEVYLSQEELEKASKFLRGKGIGENDLLIGLHPGASWPAKRWGEEKFAQLGNQLKERIGAKLLITWGPEEKELSERVTNLMHFSPLSVGNFPLRELAALLSHCHLFISNDAGPMHLAVAVGTSTIGIFGPGEPEIWFPYSEEAGHMAIFVPIACRPCHLHFCEHRSCMERVRVEDVFKQVEKILGKMREFKGS